MGPLLFFDFCGYSIVCSTGEDLELGISGQKEHVIFVFSGSG